MKTARMLDRKNEGFGLGCDTNIERRGTLRVAAVTDESAIREATALLGIDPQNFAADRMQ